MCIEVVSFSLACVVRLSLAKLFSYQAYQAIPSLEKQGNADTLYKLNVYIYIYIIRYFKTFELFKSYSAYLTHHQGSPIDSKLLHLLQFLLTILVVHSFLLMILKPCCLSDCGRSMLEADGLAWQALTATACGVTSMARSWGTTS